VGRKNPPGSGLPRLEVVVKSGSEATGIDVVDWAKRVEKLGAGEILLTSKDADGTKDSYDLEMTKALPEAVTIGKASAVLAASIFHFWKISISEAKEYLQDKRVLMKI